MVFTSRKCQFSPKFNRDLNSATALASSDGKVNPFTPGSRAISQRWCNDWRKRCLTRASRRFGPALLLSL